MSTQTDDFNPDDPGEAKPNWRRQLEDRATTAEARAQDAESKLTKLERQSAFRDAGLDLNNKQHAIFAKAYDGELDIDKIRTEAEEVGFLTPSDNGANQQEILKSAQLDRASFDAQPIAPANSLQEAATELTGLTGWGDKEAFMARAKSLRLTKQG
jgi:hypothetical protein